MRFPLPWRVPLLGVALAAGQPFAQPYPGKPVKLLVPCTPGGSQIVHRRLLAQMVGAAPGLHVTSAAALLARCATTAR